MRRRLFEADHEDFRKSVRAFVDREVVGEIDTWETHGLTGREVWRSAGRQGILGLSVPEPYGGAGQLRDYRYRVIVQEELARVGATSLSLGFTLQDDIAAPYLVELGSEAQKRRWLPPMASGEIIGAIAMTEPGTGSDLRGIRTEARRVSDGWVVNGAKTFITNGIQADLVIVVVRTDPAGGSNGFTLMLVERAMAGFERGRQLAKVGLHGQDTAELSFTDVHVPDTHVLGEVGGGFHQLVHHLPLERLAIAAMCVAGARSALDATVEYTRQRTAFGQAIADFQNTRFELASVLTDIDLCQSFVDAAVRAWNDGELTVVDAAKAKLAASEVQHRVVDRCLQLFGGYGYMLEYPIARMYLDSRAHRIFGGTNEIMRQIIGTDLLDGPA